MAFSCSINDERALAGALLAHIVVTIVYLSLLCILYSGQSLDQSATTKPGGCQVPLPTGRIDTASVAGFGQYRRMTM